MTSTAPVVAQAIGGLSLETWIGMIIAIIAFWGIAVWALIKTLGQEDQKVELLENQERIETYSPKALQDLREWIEANPNDPLAEEAKEAYNECVETLKEQDDRFYDWSEEKVENLETL